MLACRVQYSLADFATCEARALLFGNDRQLASGRGDMHLSSCTLRRLACASFALAVALCFAQPAAAQSAPEQGERPANGYWSEGRPRLFISQRSELGAPYLKPYVSAGYGLPHWIWIGVDLNAIATFEFFQAYGGVRASTPILDLAFGYRDTWSYSKRF